MGALAHGNARDSLGPNVPASFKTGMGILWFNDQQQGGRVRAGGVDVEHHGWGGDGDCAR